MGREERREKDGGMGDGREGGGEGGRNERRETGGREEKIPWSRSRSRSRGRGRGMRGGEERKGGREEGV